MLENLGQIIMIAAIVAAVAVFVGSRIWLLFKK